MHASRLAALALFASAVGSCAPQSEVRGQTLLRIDTDLPIDATQVPDAAVDTLRIDVYAAGANGELRESREFAVGDASFWPFSLGIVGPARLRVRLFAARWATPEALGKRTNLTRTTGLTPRAEVAVDRLLDIPATAELVTKQVQLSADCRGVPVQLAAGHSCINADQPNAPASEGVEAVGNPTSKIGTWPGHTEMTCSSPELADRVCVPGGFSMLGDIRLAAVPTMDEQPLPLRPVVVSPFRMDKLEYTVGRYRQLLQSGYVVRAAPPDRAQPGAPFAYCTYLGASAAQADPLPLNCVTHSLATELCGAAGGRLPTEAEWEHAASGRGQGRAFVWGNSDPSCCRASIERAPQLALSAACARRAPEPAGSHDGSNCSGGGDVSRDGVLDMAGSLLEYTADGYMSAGTCLPAGVRSNPRCPSRGDAWVLKGANWTSGYGATRRAFRTNGPGLGDTNGFRCVYPEAAP
jgi:formylglycine-generating enzyme required for sulfatase activity